ncbi:MAG: N-acetyltransferase [Armatimonadetes bacterium]|nr:N-acetyltransferase [Armatimonadota bacterium]
MNVHPLAASPPPELARALGRFEEQFHYPLGPGRFFRIDHGEDYPRFFRAMGEGVCFVAERGGSILGVMGASLRRLALPGGEERLVVYFGDVKIAPQARGGRALPRLAGAVRQWVGARATAGFAVVMDGTPVTPLRYTGRLGIPPFAEIGKIMVLRLPTAGTSVGPDDGWLTTGERGGACYLHLSAGRYACPGGNPAERSETEPLWLMEPGGRACGRVEDTRRAKRLIADDGVEMGSAHLSCFAYQDPDAGVELLRVALGHAARRGLPALFVAVAAPEAKDFCRRLEGIGAVLAPATVYGTGLEPGPLWNINTAEI